MSVLKHVYQTLFSASLVLIVSACSQVSLSYGLVSINSSTPTSQGQQNQTQIPGQPASQLSQLTILGRVQTGSSELENLNLRLIFKAAGASQETVIELSLTEFLANPSLQLKDLLAGPAEIKVELIEKQSKQVLAQTQSSLQLTVETVRSFDFVLQPGTGENSWSLRVTGGTALIRPVTDLNHLLPVNPLPQNPPVIDNNRGSKPDPEPSLSPIELNLRLISQSDESAVILWDAFTQIPTGQSLSGYRIVVDGEVIVENHPSANYTLRDLNPGQTHQVQVFPVLSSGNILGADQLAVTVDSSSGGGGGGGGSSSPSPIPNPAPIINSVTLSSDTVTGLGYPVQLTASVSDTQILANSAYSWSCVNCGDASFDRTDSPQVIWTAPTQAGTYTLQLSVSDGVNPAVTQSMQITVEHQVADVTVIGAYE